MSKQLEKIKQLIEKREQARLGGGEKAIQKQHERGRSRSMTCSRSIAVITLAWRRSNS